MQDFSCKPNQTIHNTFVFQYIHFYILCFLLYLKIIFMTFMTFKTNIDNLVGSISSLMAHLAPVSNLGTCDLEQK